MLALFFGISNKVWHIYTLGQRSQSSMKHVQEGRFPPRAQIHTQSPADKQQHKTDIHNTMQWSSIFIQFTTSRANSCWIDCEI